MSDQIEKFLDEEWLHDSWEYVNDVPRCACGEELRDDEYPGRALDEHRVRAAFTAAGVTQPEPEYEYAMEDDLGMSFAKDRRDAERHASFQSKEYHPRVVRRVKAGAWEPAPNQSDGAS